VGLFDRFAPPIAGDSGTVHDSAGRLQYSAGMVCRASLGVEASSNREPPSRRHGRSGGRDGE